MATSNPMVPTPTNHGMSHEEALYRGIALAQLRILKQQMQLGGLFIGSRRVKLDNGVDIVCSICFNREDIVVSVPPDTLVGTKNKKTVITIVHRYRSVAGTIVEYSAIYPNFTNPRAYITPRYLVGGAEFDEKLTTKLFNGNTPVSALAQQITPSVNKLPREIYPTLAADIVRSHDNIVEWGRYPRTKYRGNIIATLNSAQWIPFFNGQNIYVLSVGYNSFNRVVVFNGEATVIFFCAMVYSNDHWWAIPTDGNTRAAALYASGLAKTAMYAVPVKDIQPSPEGTTVFSLESHIASYEVSPGIDLPASIKLYSTSDNKTIYGFNEIPFHQDENSVLIHGSEVYRLNISVDTDGIIQCNGSKTYYSSLCETPNQAQLDLLVYNNARYISYDETLTYAYNAVVCIDVVNDVLMIMEQRYNQTKRIKRTFVKNEVIYHLEHEICSYTNECGSVSVSPKSYEKHYLYTYDTNSVSHTLTTSTHYSVSGYGFFDMQLPNMFIGEDSAVFSNSYYSAGPGDLTNVTAPLTNTLATKTLKDNNGNIIRSRDYVISPNHTFTAMDDNTWDVEKIKILYDAGANGFGPSFYGSVAVSPIDYSFIDRSLNIEYFASTFIPTYASNVKLIIADTALEQAGYKCFSLMFDSANGDCINVFSDSVPWKNDANSVLAFNNSGVRIIPDSIDGIPTNADGSESNFTVQITTA